MGIPSRIVRGISFDYGHVLGGLDLGELERRLVPASAQVRDERIAAMRAAMSTAFRIHDEALAVDGSHARAWHAFMHTLVSAALPQATRAELQETVEALWLAQPTKNLWRHVPAAARRLLSDLQAAGVPMVVTTNSEGRARELFVELGVLDFFVDVIDSGRLGFAKPDRRIFSRAVAALGLSEDQVVHVGDSESGDVIGAIEAGLWSVRFDGFNPAAASDPTRAHERACCHAELRSLFHRILERGDALRQDVAQGVVDDS